MIGLQKSQGLASDGKGLPSAIWCALVLSQAADRWAVVLSQAAGRPVGLVTGLNQSLLYYLRFYCPNICILSAIRVQ